MSYFEDFETVAQREEAFREGPFVVVWINGFRIEAEYRGHHCPVLPMVSIYKFLEHEGMQAHKTDDRKKIEESVDLLNQKVKEGVIKLSGAVWVHPGWEG